jgi:hypothetical protein
VPLDRDLGAEASTNTFPEGRDYASIE